MGKITIEKKEKESIKINSSLSHIEILALDLSSKNRDATSASQASRRQKGSRKAPLYIFVI